MFDNFHFWSKNEKLWKKNTQQKYLLGENKNIYFIKIYVKF